MKIYDQSEKDALFRNLAPLPPPERQASLEKLDAPFREELARRLSNFDVALLNAKGKGPYLADDYLAAEFADDKLLRELVRQEFMRQLQEVFHAAKDLPPEEREAYVHEQCAPHSAFVRDVMSRLQGFFKAEEEKFLPEQAPSGPQLNEGDVIGEKYQLKERIKSGGFGDVWKAKQILPAEMTRDVAIKFVRFPNEFEGDPFEREFAVKMFHREVKTNIEVSHPNVVQILDSGELQDRTGTPYLVMEYIKDGKAITTYCNDKRLSLDARLKLVRQVCQAVQYIHSQGSLHCDLTPNNILIAEVAGIPTVKVIDFGLSKEFQKGFRSEILQEVSSLGGTPDYAAPEQMGFGGKVSNRTDIYTLGVVLYELVTGYTPRQTDGFLKGMRENFRRQVERDDTPRPSYLIRSLDPKSSTRLSEWHGKPALKVAKEAADELDWLILKALRVQPEKRYRHATELDEDIRGFLNGTGVIARPQTIAYRIRKYLRIHALAATVLLISVSGAAVSSYFWFQTRTLNTSLIGKNLELKNEIFHRHEAELAAKVEAQKEKIAREKVEKTFAESAKVLLAMHTGATSEFDRLGASESIQACCHAMILFYDRNPDAALGADGMLNRCFAHATLAETLAKLFDYGVGELEVAQRHAEASEAIAKQAEKLFSDSPWLPLVSFIANHASARVSTRRTDDFSQLLGGVSYNLAFSIAEKQMSDRTKPIGDRQKWAEQVLRLLEEKNSSGNREGNSRAMEAVMNSKVFDEVLQPAGPLSEYSAFFSKQVPPKYGEAQKAFYQAWVSSLKIRLTIELPKEKYASASVVAELKDSLTKMADASSVVDSQFAKRVRIRTLIHLAKINPVEIDRHGAMDVAVREIMELTEQFSSQDNLALLIETRVHGALMTTSTLRREHAVEAIDAILFWKQRWPLPARYEKLLKDLLSIADYKPEIESDTPSTESVRRARKQ